MPELLTECTCAVIVTFTYRISHEQTCAASIKKIKQNTQSYSFLISEVLI